MAMRDRDKTTCRAQARKLSSSTIDDYDAPRQGVGKRNETQYESDLPREIEQAMRRGYFPVDLEILVDE